MHCPNCGDPNTRVTDSRDTGQDIRRRRECVRCGVRFTTYERVQHATLQVIKRDGRRDEFDKQKLLRSIGLACTKRPLPSGTLEKLVGEIENDLQDLGKAEVPASVIGDLTLERLRQLDPVAYVRYASVYRDYDTLDGFIDEIREFQATDVAVSDASVSQLTPHPQRVRDARQAHRSARPQAEHDETARRQRRTRLIHSSLNERTDAYVLRPSGRGDRKRALPCALPRLPPPQAPLDAPRERAIGPRWACSRGARPL